MFHVFGLSRFVLIFGGFVNVISLFVPKWNSLAFVVKGFFVSL